MLRKLLSTVLVFFLCVGAFSQSAKPKILVKVFSIGDNVTYDDGERVRQTVFHALGKTDRFQMTDAALLQSDADETGELTALAEGGYTYLVEGDILSFKVTSEVKDGKKYYNCNFCYALTLTDVKSTTTVATKTFDHASSSLGILGGLLDYTSAEEAKSSINSLIESDIKEMVLEYLPLTGTVIPTDYTVNDKKKKLEACYIDLGSDHGVRKGNFFNVSAPKTRAGRTIYTVVARLKVTEVVDGTMSECKVVKGEKEFYQEMSAFMDLDEATRQQRPFKVTGSKRTGPVALFD